MRLSVASQASLRQAVHRPGNSADSGKDSGQHQTKVDPEGRGQLSSCYTLRKSSPHSVDVAAVSPLLKLLLQLLPQPRPTPLRYVHGLGSSSRNGFLESLAFSVCEIYAPAHSRVQMSI